MPQNTTNTSNSYPFIYSTDEKPTRDFLSDMQEDIINRFGNNNKFLLNCPTVYIHDWYIKGKHLVYVGETNDIISRTRNHYDDSKTEGAWQNIFTDNSISPKLYVLGHKHFNKSLTLDIENRLIQYLFSSNSVAHAFNLKPNPQKNYYPDEEFEPIFNMIWNALEKRDSSLFLPESKIKDSALFKASPLHKLTREQEEAKSKIISRVINAIRNNEDGQIVFIEGEAGTGKTVLTSSTFYELIKGIEDENIRPIKCCLLVNHNEQITVYKDIAQKLLSIYDKDTVCKPTHFINTHNSKDKIDVAFVDEGHLLLTQGKQSYKGKNQLFDIIDRAKVTVVMFDKDQVMNSEEYWEPSLLEEVINKSKEQKNHILLTRQLRLIADDNTIKWIDSITKDGLISKCGIDTKGYDIRAFDNPHDLYRAIRDKSSQIDSSLSRLIATYDWPYNEEKESDNGYWEVKIDDFHMPWNRETYKSLNRQEKSRIKNLSWAEQPHTINEIGSTFTIQGSDLSYSGVILGPSIKYRNGKIEIHPECSFSEKAKRNRTLQDGTKKSFGEEFIKHELRVLMTRGVKGLYIYACDEQLRRKLKECIE